MIWEFLAASAGLILALLLRLWCVLPQRGLRAAARKKERKCRCLVVLGSGGHTAEMLKDLALLAAHREHLALTYVIADTDHGSQAKAEAFEAQHGKAPARLLRVPRAREVGQSYASSVLTTLKAAWASLFLVLSDLPDIVLTNGPGTCIPLAAASYIARMLGLHHVLLLYSESFACVEHLSLSGRIIYHFTDGFTVQWPQLLSEYPRAKYAGRLCFAEGVQQARQRGPPLHPADLEPLPPVSTAEGPPTAIVTVGSTKFDALTRAIDSPDLIFLRSLWDLGIRKLKVQHGAGHRPTNLGSLGNPAYQGLDVEIVDYAQGLQSELQRASLVISHAGAGTILDCLEAGRRLVVVPNEGLMANHQVQLGMALQEQHLLFCFRTGELVQSLKGADFASLRCYPKQANPLFAQLVCEMLGIKSS